VSDTPPTRPSRMPEKFVAPDLDALAALVRDARVGHFAFV
jgi:hypothetical protein